LVPLRTRLKNGDIVEDSSRRAATGQPRLAEFASTVPRAQQDQAPDSFGGKGRAPSSSDASCREGEARDDLNPKTIVADEAFAKALADFACPPKGTTCSPPSGTVRSPKQFLVRLVPRTSCARSRPKGRSLRRQARARRGRREDQGHGFDDLMVFSSPAAANPILAVSRSTGGKGDRRRSVPRPTCPSPGVEVEWDNERRRRAPYIGQLTMEVADRIVSSGLETPSGRRSQWTLIFSSPAPSTRLTTDADRPFGRLSPQFCPVHEPDEELLG